MREARALPKPGPPDPIADLYDHGQLWRETDPSVALFEREPWTKDLHLAPCGFLHSLLFEVPLEDWRAEVSAELLDDDHFGHGLYGDCVKPSYPWSVISWALLLKEPIPNLDARSPYVVRIKVNQPCRVSVWQMWHPVTR